MRKKLLAMLAVSAFALGSASAFADLAKTWTLWQKICKWYRKPPTPAN